MTWRVLFALIGLSIAGMTSFAQRPPGAEGLDPDRRGPEIGGQPGDPEPPDIAEKPGGAARPAAEPGPSTKFQHAGFFGGTGVVRFALVQGKLCLDAPHHRKGSQKHEQEQIYESITVTAERGIPSVHYVCQTPDQHLTLSVQDAYQVRIESWLPKSAERSVIEHGQFGLATWQCEQALAPELAKPLASQSGPTLLHVRQSDPATFDRHFGILISRLLGGQCLASLSRQTHRRMLTQASRPDTPLTTDQVREHVDRLASPQRQTRAIAERRLLSWGTPVLAVIDGLDLRDLDAEQSDRLMFIRRRLRSGVPDTPATLAKLLINDQDYWNRIAETLDQSQARRAVGHLARVGIPTQGTILDQHSAPPPAGDRVAQAD